ncbi:hypothetical protein MTR_0378s0010 [Medicago truncatula]|uniref:Uncharacterized protein n=1 Tax=Medicago truncatula TaxID=3880 RepID=A0A072TFM1_MEDTR|nr:hypothetical protein MTR_0378s0010 [Medicago truncatula]
MDQSQTTRVSGTLGQKLGYDKCPYLSLFVQRFEDEIFDSMGRRDLNTKGLGFVEEKHKNLCFGLGREERDSADELFAGLELMHAYDCFLDMDTLFLGSLSDNNNKK